MLIAMPAKQDDKIINIPKQEAMIEFKEKRRLTRRERRAYKRGK